MEQLGPKCVDVSFLHGIFFAPSFSQAVGFAIVFGNENLFSWKEFWKFIIELHPCLKKPDVTIITDQDKGLFGAITEEVSEVVNFHCSYHRSQNIIKMCGRPA